MMKLAMRKGWFVGATAVGILSGFAVMVTMEGAFLFSGVVFGIVSALYFSFTLPRRRSLWRLVLWVVASGASYFLAIQSSAVGGELADLVFSNDILSILSVFGLAGLVGAFVVGIAFHFLLLRLDWRHALALVLTGLLLAPLPMMISGGWLLGVHFVWQTGVMLVFGHRIYQENRLNGSTEQAVDGRIGVRL